MVWVYLKTADVVVVTELGMTYDHGSSVVVCGVMVNDDGGAAFLNLVLCFSQVTGGSGRSLL